MNKKSFLKELERNLSILDESELKDIINEYKDIIEEKVKAGKTEEEAVSEFGSMDELCSEILKAYKINPKFSSANSKGKEAVKTFEEGIKYAASELSKAFRSANESFSKSGKSLSMELVFEIIIKIIIMLVILSILRIPFLIIEGLGLNIFNFSFAPADFVFGILWRILAGIIYLVVAVCMFWIMFKEYFSGFEAVEEELKKANEIKKSEEVKQPIKPESKKKDEIVTKRENGITSTLIIVVRIFVLITFLLPIWFIQAGIIVALILVVYYVILGIEVLGLAIVLCGLLIGFSGAGDLIYKLAFNIKKVNPFCIVPFLISVVILAIGGVITVHNIFKFEYVNELPRQNIEFKTVEKIFNIKEDKEIDLYEIDNIEYEINASLADSEVKVVISYPDMDNKISNIYLSESRTKYYLRYSYSNYRNIRDFKKIYNLVIEDLKENKVYNYSKLYRPTVVLLANETTMKIIKKEK